MRPDKDLIARLKEIDNRIEYPGFDMFDDLERTKRYLRTRYKGSEPLRLRGVALYLAEKGTLTFTRDDFQEAQDSVMRGFYSEVSSPVKNIIQCLGDGCEKPEFFVSEGSYDLGMVMYGKMAARDLHDIFPLHKHLIYPGIMVYRENGLMFDGRTARVSGSDSLKTVFISEI